MRFRRHAVATLIGVAAVTVISTSVISNRLFSGLTSAVEEGQFELMQSITESTLRITEGRAQARASMIADLPTVRRRMAAGDREGLFEELKDMFAVQRDQFGAKTMQFHQPPALTFLRMQEPERHGDDVSAYRPMVAAVNRDHAPRHGISLGRAGPAITAVVPLLAPDGHHVGSFEVGLEFGPMLDELKSSYGLEATLFVLEEPLRRVSTGVRGEVLSEENRVGRHVKFYSTNWDLVRRLVRSDDLAHVEEPVRYARDAVGVPYGVLVVPVRNIAGEPLGVLMVASDFSGTREAAGRSLVWQCLLALFASVVIAGAVL
ncbi:MAG: cache domain-containing protein, partial [Phycisphaerales bacterium]